MVTGLRFCLTPASGLLHPEVSRKTARHQLLCLWASGIDRAAHVRHAGDFAWIVPALVSVSVLKPWTERFFDQRRLRTLPADATIVACPAMRPVGWLGYWQAAAKAAGPRSLGVEVVDPGVLRVGAAEDAAGWHYERFVAFGCGARWLRFAGHFSLCDWLRSQYWWRDYYHTRGGRWWG
jgi:hypothetical protein